MLRYNTKLSSNMTSTIKFIPGYTTGSRNVIHDGCRYCLGSGMRRPTGDALIKPEVDASIWSTTPR